MVKVEEIAEKYKDYEVDEEELKEILVQPKPKTVWDLKEGYRYWWIDTKGIVHSALWMDCNGVDKEVHILRRAFGNCFLTKEEAEFEVMKRKVETSLLKYGRREFKPHQDNLYPQFINKSFSSSSFNLLYKSNPVLPSKSCIT